MNKVYTGVGSRSTPIQILDLMVRIARVLGTREWILRSGAAEGADAAFEAGADDVGGPKEIWVPWRGFAEHKSSLMPTVKAFEIASTVHPVWHKLGDGVQKLHARNIHQVLGRDLSSPSTMLVCWTPGGREVGGTATAIKVANAWKVPVWNLGIEAVREKFERWVESRELTSPKLN